jgi:MYXO-CTERM domain-containing protein
MIQPDAPVSLRFTGTGITFVGANDVDLGEADIELDGVVVDHVVQTGPHVAQVVHFAALDLEPGIHTIRVVPTTGQAVLLDFFDVHRALLEQGEPGEPEDTGVVLPPATVPMHRPDEDGCGCRSASFHPFGPAGLALLVLGARRRRRSP